MKARFARALQTVRSSRSRETPYVEYPRQGNPYPDVRPSKRAGLLLSGGGGHVPEALRWMHAQITGDPNVTGGDIVVIRCTEDDSYSPEFLKAAPFNSVQTVCVPADATPEELERAAKLVRKAHGVFFSGGQQKRYVGFQGSPLMNAVQGVYDRGGVVGGTSAGLAILGEHVFDGKGVASAQVTTRALALTPRPEKLSFTHDLFDFAPMKGVLTDTHFRDRDRFGRLVAFLTQQDAPRVLGVGVDEETVVAVDQNGEARVFANVREKDEDAPEKRLAPGGAYFVQAEDVRSAPGGRLGPVTVHVDRLVDPDERFDFGAWQGTGLGYDVTVDGRGLFDGARTSRIYTVDPYTGEQVPSRREAQRKVPRSG